MLNKENFARLAAHLERLPKDYDHFSMVIFCTDSKLLIENAAAIPHTCGTTACALGHGPLAGVLLDDKHVVKGRQVVWNDYSRDKFGVDPTTDLNLWTFLFDACWDSVDGHHYAAAARIRYVLADNPVPRVVNHDGCFDTNEAKKAVKLYERFLV